jgi:hypothetical protein
MHVKVPMGYIQLCSICVCVCVVSVEGEEAVAGAQTSEYGFQHIENLQLECLHESS